MDLYEYTKQENIDHKKLAEELFISKVYAGKLILGKLVPSTKIAKLISIYTKEKVTVDEIMNPKQIWHQYSIYKVEDEYFTTKESKHKLGKVHKFNGLKYWLKSKKKGEDRWHKLTHLKTL